jgi:hypothetical protein
MVKHHRPKLRQADKRGWREARFFVTEHLNAMCVAHGIDPESTMHTEYTITGNESTTYLYGIIATARHIRMPVDVYLHLRTHGAFAFAREALKMKAILV